LAEVVEQPLPVVAAEVPVVLQAVGPEWEVAVAVALLLPEAAQVA